ncbi:MAG: hypothetical protein LBV29_01395 [Azoarcus sp.]|nr:hypothetical protein [Azoarcus sp.]
MLYRYYFERDKARSHLSLDEWKKAIEVVPHVRAVTNPRQGLGEWIGIRYIGNPHEVPVDKDAFQNRPERVNDAEVFFPDFDRWFRAFYWRPLTEHPGLGVVTFESPPGDIAPEDYPVWVVAQELAKHLGAELVGENESAYE